MPLVNLSIIGHKRNVLFNVHAHTFLAPLSKDNNIKNLLIIVYDNKF